MPTSLSPPQMTSDVWIIKKKKNLYTYKIHHVEEYGDQYTQQWQQYLLCSKLIFELLAEGPLAVCALVKSLWFV